MTLRSYLIVFVFGLSILTLGAFYEKYPGYMDADYYYLVGRQLKEGEGFNEMVLWNYLDDPAGLPHPSNAYWMPFTSIFAGAGMWIAGCSQFRCAQFGFIFLASLIPPLTAFLATRLNENQNQSFLAGLIAALPGLYLPYLSTTDSFALYMVSGTIFLLITGLVENEATLSKRFLFCCLLGLSAGILHLTRADGVLWLLLLFPATFGGLVFHWRWVKEWKRNLLSIGGSLLGYLAIMGPWMYRNLKQFGTPLSPGGSHILWFTDYNDLFIYPASALTFQHWWQSGLGAVLSDRIWTLGQNLQTSIAVQGGVFLTPLIIIGVFRKWSDTKIRIGMTGWILTFLVMTLVFPYAGGRGGFFHSASAVQPMIWAVAPVGLEAFVNWGSRIRHWDIRQARRFFQVGLISLLCLISILIFQTRVIGDSSDSLEWEKSYQKYAQVEQKLIALGAAQGDVAMVNNAPGYYLVGDRPSVSIPYARIETLLQVARRYHVKYLLVEFDQILGDEKLFSNPVDREGLRYLATKANVRIYQFTDN